MIKLPKSFSGWLITPIAGWMIFSAGIGLRIIWILSVNITQPYDAAIYYDGAVTIYNGFALPKTGIPCGHWPVGYQGFLAGLFHIFGESPLVAQWANIVLSAIILISTARIVRIVSHNVLAERVSMLIVALFPSLIVICSVSMPEMLYLALMLLGIWGWLALPRIWMGSIWLGVTYGLVTLVRPQLLLLAVAYTMLRRQRETKASIRNRMIRTVLVVSILLLVISPWLFRNYRVYDQFVFVSTNSGHMLLIGNNPHAYGGVMTPDKAAPELAGKIDNGADGDRMARKLAIQYIKDHPIKTITLWPNKLWYTFRSGLGMVNWVKAGLENNGGNQSGWFRIVQYICQAYYMSVCLLAVIWIVWAGLIRRMKKVVTDPMVRYALPAIFLLVLPCIITVGGARYNVAMLPWFSMIAASAIATWLGRTDDAIDSCPSIQPTPVNDLEMA